MYFAQYNRLNLHVTDSNRAVIRAARQRLKPSARRSRDVRSERHAFFRAMLEQHKAASRLYREVMYNETFDD